MSTHDSVLEPYLKKSRNKYKKLQKQQKSKTKNPICETRLIEEIMLFKLKVLSLNYEQNKKKNVFLIRQIIRVLTKRLMSRKEGNVIFNDALNTFYLRLYGVRHMVKDHSDSEREETRCHHMGYSFRLAARFLLYAPSHRQDSTHHGFCYTSRGALAGTRNSSMGPPHEGLIQRPIAP